MILKQENGMNNIKVLLISISKSIRYSNAGIDLIAGFLRINGFEVDIKYFYKDETYEEIITQISTDYTVYGMSVYSSNYERFLKLSEYLKEKCNAVVVWGGAFPSMYYKDIFSVSRSIAYIILGDGERPFLYLLKRIENEKSVSHASIATYTDFKHKKNACNENITYLPAYDFYNYVVPERNSEKIHCIQSKNNVCTGNCSFCYERKGKIFYKSIDLIVEEINYVNENFGVKKFFFSDDNLLDPNDICAKKRMISLCDALLKLNKKLIFTCYIKATSFNKSDFDSKILSLMRKTGFTTMFIGIESGNEEDLLLYNKKTTVEDNLNIVNILKRHDIIPQIGFINFNPYTTPEKLKKNYEFLVEIGSNNLYSFARSFMNIYKGTAIYNKANKDGLIKSSYTILNDLEYDFSNSDIKPIVIFLREKLIPKIEKLQVETSWLIQRCKDCSVINPKAEQYIEILSAYENEEANIIKNYFYILYVDRDLKKSEQKLDEFISYFINIQPQLKQIYSQIKKLYIESDY